MTAAIVRDGVAGLVGWTPAETLPALQPRRGAGEPFIGADAQRVLEFSDRPVLVVPA